MERCGSITRRDFLVGLEAGVGCLSMVSLAAPGTSQPSFVLCMADDQGWGDVGYNGHPVLKTPHLDELAKSGLRFDRFYAAAPVCSPTRGSVMTGRHPNRFGCFKWGYSLRPQEITIAEALKSAGYVTGHFGKWHLGSVREGSPVNPGASGFDEWLSAENFYDNDPILSNKGKAVQLKGESSMIAADSAIDFLSKAAADGKPFLAVVWFGSPHSPHKASAENRAVYASEEDLHKRNFYGEISGIDQAMGKLRKTIADLGIQDTTLLWYCSDNGGLPKVGSTGGRGHKGSIYEGGLRVPAIIEWPKRIPEPRITSVPCNTSDIYPTVLDLAGVSVPNQPVLDGVSLVTLIDGTMGKRPTPMGFWDYPAKGIKTPNAQWMAEVLAAQTAGTVPEDRKKLRLDAGKIEKQYPTDRFPGHAAWLDWPWKLHRIENRQGVTFELYNLLSDAMEKKDLVAAEPERVASMTEQLTGWLKSVVRSLNGMDYK